MNACVFADVEWALREDASGKHVPGIRSPMRSIQRRESKMKSRFLKRIITTLAVVGMLTPVSCADAQKPKKSDSKKTSKSKTSKKTSEKDNLPKLGVLKKIGRSLYESTAGLRYGPGSREGHRIKHIMRHAKDQPTRPGKHGVFDANKQQAVLAVLDEAWLVAKFKKKRAKIDKQGKRTVYTVDMKRRIGYVGGRVGKQRRHPVAKHVRMVLEGRNVITAFPLRP